MRGIPELPELPRTPETPGYLPSAEGVQVIPDDFEIDTDVVAAEDAEAPDPESAFFENLADKMSKEDIKERLSKLLGADVDDYSPTDK